MPCRRGGCVRVRVDVGGMAWQHQSPRNHIPRAEAITPWVRVLTPHARVDRAALTTAAHWAQQRNALSTMFAFKSATPSQARSKKQMSRVCRGEPGSPTRHTRTHLGSTTKEPHQKHTKSERRRNKHHPTANDHSPSFLHAWAWAREWASRWRRSEAWLGQGVAVAQVCVGLDNIESHTKCMPSAKPPTTPTHTPAHAHARPRTRPPKGHTLPRTHPQKRIPPCARACLLRNQPAPSPSTRSATRTTAR